VPTDPPRPRLVRTIAARALGRYLVAPPASGGAAPLVVGFHGYGESAETWLDQVARVPAAADWLVVSVQALHRFYNTKTETTVGSWMTRLDRDQLIAANVAYVGDVIDEVRRAHATMAEPVYFGFSQGVAMAYRAAALAGRGCRAVVALGGDVPPDLDTRALSACRRALAGCGARDPWYTPAALEADAARLREAGVGVEIVVFDGGHEWGAPFLEACDRWLAELGREARGGP